MQAQATFVYPPDNAARPLASVQDQLQVTYITPYNKANLTLYCPEAATSSSYLVWDADDNPLLKNGTYIIHAISDLDFEITQYPVICHFRVYQAANYTTGHDGGVFTLTSTAGPAKTLKAAASSTSGSAFATQSATKTGAASASVTRSGSSSDSLPSPTGSASPSPSPSPSPTSSGLSSGAAAGIGVGVGLAVILIASAVVFMMWSRRRKRRTRPGLAAEHSDAKAEPFLKPELPAQERSSVYKTPDAEHDRQELMSSEITSTAHSHGAAELP